MNIQEATQAALEAPQFTGRRKVFIRRTCDYWNSGKYHLLVPRSIAKDIKIVDGEARDVDFTLTYVDLTASDWVVSDQDPDPTAKSED